MPVAANNEVTTTELQQSIFNAPPSALAGLPPKVSSAAQKSDVDATRTDEAEGGPQGLKRRRDDESDDEGAPMEEDDSDAPMEASSDDDSS